MVRFKNNKARNVCEAVALFGAGGRYRVRELLTSQGGPFEMREWLVEGVRGMGCKEASHFLRNIGVTRELMILDRHILKNLTLLGITEQGPATLTRSRYLDLEKRMKEWSRSREVEPAHLDMTMWYRETGDIFK